MLSNIMCWVIAIALIFSESLNREDMYVKMLLAIGFIFVGTVSKAVDTYRVIHAPAKQDNGITKL